MPTRLYTAPAGAGKTDFLLKQARDHARRWEPTRVVVADSRQSLAAYRRLARDGVMGVRIQTPFGLARELLERTGSPLTLISDPVQVRFLRLLVDETKLDYYRPLRAMPGFIRALRGFLRSSATTRSRRRHSGGRCGGWASPRGWRSWPDSTPAIIAA
jgi:hypothetical protein